jgi:hypothetical protein
MKFPLERILTAPPSEYCESNGVPLSSYRLVGVHAPVIGAEFPQDALVKNLPNNTEVVCSYIFCTGRQDTVCGDAPRPNSYVAGTAMVRKDTYMERS